MLYVVLVVCCTSCMLYILYNARCLLYELSYSFYYIFVHCALYYFVFFQLYVLYIIRRIVLFCCKLTVCCGRVETESRVHVHRGQHELPQQLPARFYIRRQRCIQ